MTDLRKFYFHKKSVSPLSNPKLSILFHSIRANPCTNLYLVVYPPSTTKLLPVTQREASLKR